MKNESHICRDPEFRKTSRNIPVMDKELEKYYEAQFALFAEPGWRDFVQQVSEMLAATNSIAGIEDAKALHYRQGECSIMQWVISWENMVREAHKQLMEDDNGTA